MRERLTDNPERLKIAAGPRREIPDDFKYDPKKLKNLKKILHNVTISLGTLTSSINEFAKIKGPAISPDGLLGGQGYIIPIKEIKESFNTSVRSLSDIADCLADELTNPRWDVKDDKDVKKLIEEKEEAIKEVEEVEEEIGPDDLVTNEEDNTEPGSKPPEEEGKVEDDEAPPAPAPEQYPEQENKTASEKGENVLASAVQKSLVNFFQNK